MDIFISKGSLDLDKTLDCGQCFSWDKLGDKWYGSIAGTVVELKQDDDKITVHAYDAIELERIVEYFGLEDNYVAELQSIDLNDYETKVLNNGKGIRILRQPLEETILSFIVSQNNNIKRIKKIIGKIALFGKETPLGLDSKYSGYCFYEFPSLSTLYTLCIEEKEVGWVNMLGLGYRADYFAEAVKRLYEDEDYIEELRIADYVESIKLLKELKGVGDKVANCIALFGLHHLDAFPVDVHMKEIIDREFNGNLDIKKYKGYAGVMQQYMFYSEI